MYQVADVVAYSVTEEVFMYQTVADVVACSVTEEVVSLCYNSVLLCTSIGNISSGTIVHL